MRDDRYPTLARLMGAYYHQDWPLDADDVMEPFDAFVREELAAEVHALAVDLEAFLAESLSEDEMAERIEAMWGEVAPQEVSGGYGAWLSAMLARLEASGVASPQDSRNTEE